MVYNIIISQSNNQKQKIMIKIEHIKAHLPSKNCQLSFMLRKKQASSGSSEDLKQNEIVLTEDYVDLEITCSIQLGEFSNYKDTLQLCVIAVPNNSNDKICVGWIEIIVQGNVYSQEAPLKGVNGQDGYIVYSIMKQSSTKNNTLQRSIQMNSLKSGSEKKQPSRGFIKYKNSSSSSSYSENQMSFESKSGSESPFRKNKYPPQLDSKTDQYRKLLDELYHQVLEQQLFNQKALNKIQQNQIFQLRYKQRIQALLGSDQL